MRRSLLLALGCASLLLAPAAAQEIRYEFSMPNAAHHEAEITVTWTGVAAGQPLEARMSRSSPGRYALHEFAKNVYAVRAEDSRGRPLSVTRPNPHQWNIAGHDGTVRLRYTLFADRADGTYSQVDRTHAHLNAPATWMWARGLESRPVRVTFSGLPASWQVATQLFPTDQPQTFTAPDFQYLMDSPVMAAELDIRSWEVSSGGRTQTIRLAIHHAGTPQEVDRYVEMAKAVVLEQAGVFGELPRFDGGVYTFLACYLPHASGDGMEHRNSTVLTSSGSLAQAALGLLGTVSHEFIHIWNVERIRPRSLEPFNFEEANMSGELWLAEGFTSYLGPLTIRTAGITDDRQYARSLSGTVNAIQNAPGRQYFSAHDMSLQAPFVDAATSVDPQNRQNTFISYYTWGAGIGLALDLTLRQRSNLTLDDYMQALWAEFGRTERPYTMANVRATLGRVTRSNAFADDFFARFIEGQEAPDFGTLLAQAGFVVRQAAAGQAWLGDVAWRAEMGGLLLLAGPQVGTPVYQAGMDRGDRLVSIDGREASTPAVITEVLAARRPGDTVPLTFESRGQRLAVSVVLAESPRVEVLALEEVGQTPSAAQLAFRGRWLASRSATR
ncbi:MAG: M61 family metallopeptidase [Gemmatimonadales bacterium]